MKEQITFNQIKTFRENYIKNSNNKIIENEITKKGIAENSIDSKVIEENPPIFNIELPDGKIYDQKDSLRCWIYSGLNFIKRDMAKNLNMNIFEFELSPTFIAFYDRLEKANTLYNNVINKNIDLKI